MKARMVVLLLAVLATGSLAIDLRDSGCAKNYDPKGMGWADSYEADGKCFCAASGESGKYSFDHNISNTLYPTPAGSKTIKEICEAIGLGPVPKGQKAHGYPIYNDVQCGNGPPNDAGDEDPECCPGRVDLGREGCYTIGPKWDLSVFGGLQASFTASPTSGIAPLKVSFDADDSDEAITGFSWDFGDGATAAGSSAEHTFSDEGTFNVVLEVTDGEQTGSATIAIVVVGPIGLPGIIQAEAFIAHSGVETQNTSDDGGGENIGYIDDGDWAEYAVTVAETGPYVFDARVASGTEGGTIEFSVGSQILGELTVPSTGGWQKWTDVSTTLSLDEGATILRTTFKGSDVSLLNVNHYTVTASSTVIFSSPRGLHSDAVPAHGLYYSVSGRLIRRGVQDRHDGRHSGVYLFKTESGLKRVFKANSSR